MNKRKTITLVLLSIFFIGLSVLLYPAVSSYWNSKTQSKAVTDYDAYLENLLPEDYSGIFEAADMYNASLSSLTYPLIDYEQLYGYNDVLNVNKNGMIGYISIDKIQTELPIYHGTNPEVLNIACGHLEGSSLPVGGESTHCVLSAHRGLPSAKLFTNLDKLEIGDTFRITVLDRVITYQVDQIRVVNPTDINDLMIESGKDYCTLFTCTPYGINTHRLLVRGVRTENAVQRIENVTSDAYLIDKLIVTPMVALPILFVLILYVFFMPVKKKVIIENDDNDDI